MFIKYLMNGTTPCITGISKEKTIKPVDVALPKNAAADYCYMIKIQDDYREKRGHVSMNFPTQDQRDDAMELIFDALVDEDSALDLTIYNLWASKSELEQKKRELTGKEEQIRKEAIAVIEDYMDLDEEQRKQSLPILVRAAVLHLFYKNPHWTALNISIRDLDTGVSDAFWDYYDTIKC